MQYYETESSLGHDISVELETLTEYKVVLGALQSYYFCKLEEFGKDEKAAESSRVAVVQKRWLEMVEIHEDALAGLVVQDRSFQLTPKEVEIAARMLLDAEGTVDGRNVREVGLEMYQTIGKGHMDTTVERYGNGSGQRSHAVVDGSRS